MPMTYTVDSEHQLVKARIFGVLVADDIKKFVAERSTREEIQGFDMFVDLSDVESIDYQSPAQLIDIVRVATKGDNKHRRSKMAIVVGSDSDFGLSRMYQSYRDSQPGANRELRIFRTMEEAMAWLGQS